MIKQKTYNDKATNELILAVKCGNLNNVKLAIKENADVNGLCYDDSILTISMMENNLHVVKYLIDKGADPTFYRKNSSDTLLSILIKYLKKNAPNNSDNSTKIAKFRDWLSLYKTQKKLLKTYPKTLIIFDDNKFLHPLLKEENKHLLTASDLNLL